MSDNDQDPQRWLFEPPENRESRASEIETMLTDRHFRRRLGKLLLWVGGGVLAALSALQQASVFWGGP